MYGDVFGNIHDHRSGTPGSGDNECLLDGNGQVAHILDQEIVFDAGARDAHRIDFLKRIQTDRRGGDLTGEDHHWNGIHVGSGDAGDRIRRSGTGSDQRHPYPAGCAGICIRRMHPGLLMAHQDVFELVLLENFVIDVEHGSARVAEYKLDPLLCQTTDNYFCPC